MKTISLKTILIHIFVIIIVTVLPHTGFISFFPFIYTIPILIFIWLYLKNNNETFTDIGFSFKNINYTSIVVGIIASIFIFLFMQWVFFPTLESFIQFENVDIELYSKIRGNKSFFIFILVMGWVIGGLYEEIVFHGFIFYHLEKIINHKYKTHISFVITSVIFGVYHYQLGTADAINAFMAGAGYLGLFLLYNRNLWYSIFCHAFYNTIVITLLYLNYI